MTYGTADVYQCTCSKIADGGSIYYATIQSNGLFGLSYRMQSWALFTLFLRVNKNKKKRLKIKMLCKAHRELGSSVTAPKM
jgi:hypothetical protein